jgi:hypothetical protein
MQLRHLWSCIDSEKCNIADVGSWTASGRVETKDDVELKKLMQIVNWQGSRVYKSGVRDKLPSSPSKPTDTIPSASPKAPHGSLQKGLWPC